MKRTLSLFSIVAVCCAVITSCKNAKTAEPSEEIQAQKVALADSVMAEIDSLVEQFLDEESKSFRISTIKLTDAEKIVKPDYLLNPALSDTFVTKSQKINALGIYLAEFGIRKLYDMPCEEVKEVIAKLAADVDHPIDIDLLTNDEPALKKIKKEYEICKERGDLAYFWQFQYAVVVETSYLLVQTPDLFNKITDEQLKAYGLRNALIYEAFGKLAQYYDEMEALRQFRDKIRYSTSKEWEKICQSRESQIQTRLANKDKYIARRNALLQ